MLGTLRHLFTPHHTNNHRPRVLHPIGMAVMVALLLGLNSGVELLEEHQPAGLVLGYASNINAGDVLVQTNQERVSQGLPPLHMSDKLSQAAAAKAADMFQEDYWAHISPAGVPPWTFIKNAGYRYSVAGENLARDFDTTEPMVEAWMASPTHKANIVHSKYTETGIAVANGTLGGVETTLVVQMFGLPTQPVLGNNQTNTTSEPQITQTAETETLPIAETEEVLEANVALAPTQQAVLSETQATSLEADSSPIFVSPMDVKKSVVLAVIGMIMAVLVLDELIIRRRQTVRFVGRNVAHMSFLVLALIIIWNVIQPGMIQ